MPFEEHTRASAFQSFGEPDKQNIAEPGFRQSMAPAMRLENDVAAMFQILGERDFEEDAEFDLGARLGKSPLAQNHSNSFVGVGSDEEFTFVENKINQELKDREVLGAAGWAGLGAAMFAGFLSPVSLMPLTGAARGGKGVAQAFGLAAVGAGAQEGVLLAAQETRTGEEAFTGFATATVLGGLLGSAAVALRAGDLERIAAGMDRSHGETTILPAEPPGTFGSVGAAAATQPSAGRLQRKDPVTGAAVTTTAQIGPVTRVIDSDNPDASVFMAQLATGGATLERNSEGVASARGGTVEARIKPWAKPVAESLQILDDAFGKYWLGTTPMVARNFRARIGSFVGAGRSGKLNYKEFKEQVTHAAFSNDKHEIPEVAEAAAFIRKNLYDPLFEEARRVGLLPEDVDLKGDMSYLNRIYNHDAITARPDLFVEKLAAHIEQKLETAAKAKFLKIKETNAKNLTDIEDLQRAADEATRLREDFQAQLDAMQEDPLAELADELSEARSGARAQAEEKPVLEEAAAAEAREAGVPVSIHEPDINFKQEVKRIKEQGGEELEKFLADRALLRRRLRMLNRGVTALEEKQRRALERIETIEEKNLSALRRAGKKALSIQKRMDKLTDEELDAELNKLRGQFSRLSDTLERGERRLGEIAEKAEVSEFAARQRRISGKQREGLAKEVEEGLVADTKSGKIASSTREAINQGIEDARRGVNRPPSGKRAAEAYAAAQARFTARREELTALRQEGTAEATAVTERGLREELAQEAREARLDSISDRIGAATDFDRQAAREAVQEAYTETLKRIDEVNSRRAIRAQKLEQRAMKLDPKRVETEVDNIRDRIRARNEGFADGIRERGADEFDLEEGSFNFREAATAQAEIIKERILGQDRRVVGIDILAGERGPELARMLDFDSREFADFLEFDIEVLLRAYARTMAPDVEIARTFGGSPNAAPAWDRLNQSFRNEIRVLTEKLEAENAPPAKREKEFNKLAKKQREIKEDLGVVIDRLRHRRGIPQNPHGMMFRMGKAALALNTLRLMGSVAVSSVPDVARPVMKYGLTRTFRDGFVPLITNWKQFKMSAIEAKKAGVALDVILSSRAQSVFDIFDDVGRGAKWERATQYISNNMGNIAGFNYWTSGMKQLTAAIVNADLIENMELLLTKQNVSEARLRKATEMLASLGIDDTNIRPLWEHINKAGNADRVNGVLLPNTEEWTKGLTGAELRAAIDAQRTYRAALAQATDDTIITPGAERPNWVDENIGLRLVSQFRSFAFSSTTKTMMAGLQQRDMAVVNGMAFSLALGALSYYLWAVSVGGKAYNEMLAADEDKWADEAIDRSGLLAVLSEVRRIGERVPAVQDYMTFSGARTTRRQGTDLVGTILGPTYDLAKTGANVIVGLDDPTKSTVSQFRDLVPFQNVFYLRQLLDQVEGGVQSGLNLPEKRQ